jgi:spore coat protein H
MISHRIKSSSLLHIGKLFRFHSYVLFFSFLFVFVSSCRKEPEDENGPEAARPELEINGALCPYDLLTNSWFFTLDNTGSGSFTVNLKGDHITGFKKGNQTFSNGSTLTKEQLTDASTSEITPVRQLKDKPGQTVSPCKLVISGLPLVHITLKDTIPNEPKTECFISIMDPFKKTNHGQFWFPPMRAGIERRGGLSQQFPKKSYALEFRMPKTDMEVDSGTQLFGLRDDGDWVLDAMYIDKARMRNRLSTDLWLAINKVPHVSDEPKAVNGTRGQFAELFINEYYQGLYCMTERIDRNQLNLDRKEGMSYKASYWSNSTEFIQATSTANNSSETWNGWELIFQGENALKSVPPVRWEPLRNFIGFAVTASDEAFISSVSSKIDFNNLIDYLLFMNVLGADDNTGKNTLFSIYNNNNPKFFITPWDLDATWGRKWEGSRIELTSGDFIGVTGILSANSKYCRPSAFFIRLMKLNPSEFKSKLKARWGELKAGEFAINRLSSRVITYKELFRSSGAYTRETVKWPGSVYDLDSETQYMLSWIEGRIAQVDSYINGL